MTTSPIGGHDLGLLDSSATLLNRNDRTGAGHELQQAKLKAGHVQIRLYLQGSFELFLGAVEESELGMQAADRYHASPFSGAMPRTCFTYPSALAMSSRWDARKAICINRVDSASRAMV